uniref:ANF_receptor domain-containing protein n=1 Tax=Panagrellus redivivus TaxID=6233 RepID=A0A7E4UWL3_PANRE
MGCHNSKEDEKIFDSVDHGRGNHPSTYMALALLNANKAASLLANDLCPPTLDSTVAEQLILRAKHDGQTVSVINNCLYLDYKFIGYMPPGAIAV